MAHARQKATFHPELITNNAPKAKMKRRVSLGVVIDAETGTIVESGNTKRHSQRSHTMLNTSMTDLRIKDEMEKKVRTTCIPLSVHVYYCLGSSLQSHEEREIGHADQHKAS